MLPEFNSEGDLPSGVHATGWHEFQSRFGLATARRVWVFGRLQALVEFAAKTGQLRRVFVWGSFVTMKPAPKDLDILLITDFEVERIAPPSRDVFDSTRAGLPRYRGTGVDMIQTDDQVLLAQQCVANLRRILLEARKVHSAKDYLRLSEPILLEVQQREQEILEYLSSGLEQPLAS
jgi:hypothetical protein